MEYEVLNWKMSFISVNSLENDLYVSFTKFLNILAMCIVA